MKHDENQSSLDEFVTTREAARQLGVSLRMVQLRVESGILKAWQTAGGHRRIASSSLNELLSKRASALVDETLDSEMTVVIVEDEEQTRRLYKKQLQRLNPSIHTLAASDGFEALLLIGRHNPRVVLTDLKMPGMDGFRMIAALQGNTYLKHTEIIVISGLTSEEIQDRGGLPAGVTYFEKPVSIEQLSMHIQSLLHMSAVNVG